MQKKLIALAVASLVSGAAFAQVAPNNVTMSGIVDMGYQYSSDNLADDTPNQSALNDGGHDSSRLKFAGTEDLGNGLKVGFNLEYRMRLDTHNDGGVKTDNQNIWLGGNFGTVTAGSFGTALDDINGYSETVGMGWGNGTLDMFTTGGWHANAVKYNSPNFNGLDFMAAYSTHNANENDLVDENLRAYSARVSYVAGPVKVGLAATRHDRQTLSERVNEWLLSGSYDFGPVKVGAGYSRTTTSGDEFVAGDLDRRTAWRVGVGAPIGAADAVALSYTRVKQTYIDTDDSEKASGWGLSYTHNLSKRTNLYASYGQINQDEDEAIASMGDGYQKAFKVGLRHQF